MCDVNSCKHVLQKQEIENIVGVEYFKDLVMEKLKLDSANIRSATLV